MADAPSPNGNWVTGWQEPIPVFLLKTKSSPTDGYEDLLSRHGGDLTFTPTFVPVLEHRFVQEGLMQFRHLLRRCRIANSAEASYGGLVFTSQRAVEAFARLVAEGPGGEDAGDGWPRLQDVPIYSVGPATTRALRAIPQEPPLQIFGDHTGNGENLSQFIQEHYAAWYADRAGKPALLFPVGEVRREIIPQTLMDDSLASDRRIQVDEVVVYGTGVMESFGHDFSKELLRTATSRCRWVVVFSPTGCDTMLQTLGLLDPATGRATRNVQGRRTTLVATIGPTTRKHLQDTFGFDPDVCSSKPSPEGILQGLSSFMAGAVGGQDGSGEGPREQRHK